MQLADKRILFIKEKSLLRILRFRKGNDREAVSGRKFDQFMDRIEKLRNDLAHSSEIPSDDWKGIMSDVRDLEGFLEDLEASDQH
jgi:hypothetical protein